MLEEIDLLDMQKIFARRKAIAIIIQECKLTADC
jgi:hypothetical protein